MKEEFVFILDDFRVPPSLVKALQCNITALSGARWAPMYPLPPPAILQTELAPIRSPPLPLLAPTPRLKPVPPPSRVTQLHGSYSTGRTKRRPFFPLPRVRKWKWHKVVTQSLSLSLFQGTGLHFYWFYSSRWSSCILFYFNVSGGSVTGGKNLKDRPCWFIVGWLFKF